MISTFERIVQNIPERTTHIVGAGSGLTGLALWADIAQRLTVIAGFFATLLAGVGAIFYAGYWALKLYAKWRRVRKGDYSDE